MNYAEFITWQVDNDIAENKYDMVIDNKYYMVFRDEDEAWYWRELYNLDCPVVCCNGYLNALELTMKED
jgi:hypothetical protein